MSKVIGNKLRRLRKSKGLTQQEVANISGVTRSTLSNYEIGRRTPRLKDLQKLAKAFGVGLDYFGISPKDEAFDLLTRARDVFDSKAIDRHVKEELYQEFMKLYLKLRG